MLEFIKKSKWYRAREERQEEDLRLKRILNTSEIYSLIDILKRQEGLLTQQSTDAVKQLLRGGMSEFPQERALAGSMATILIDMREAENQKKQQTK